MLGSPNAAHNKTVPSPDTMSTLLSPVRKLEALVPRQLDVSALPQRSKISVSNSNPPLPAIRRGGVDDAVDSAEEVVDTVGVGSAKVHGLTGNELQLQIAKDFATRDLDNPGQLDLCPEGFCLHTWLQAMRILLHDFARQTMKLDNPSRELVEANVAATVAEYRTTKTLAKRFMQLERILVGKNNISNYMKYLMFAQFDLRKRV